MGPAHPMKPIRLKYTYDLLDAYKAFENKNSKLLAGRRATDKEILSYHSTEYFQGVQSLGREENSVDPASFNFDYGDNPFYKGMDEAALLSTGSTMAAVDILLSGSATSAFNISGGLHHAMPDHAYGFCVFNDPVIAINAFLEQNLKVAYVDIDCHHGDGVQLAYYGTDRVLTISMHESGSYLFPGTGSTSETGTGAGKGYSVNIPLYPYTTDEDYMWAFKETVPQIVDQFQPDVLVTQLGIDTHFLDPITHLALTVQGHAAIVEELKGISPEMWLALGGGGYDTQSVARAWTLDYGIISDQKFDNIIPEPYSSLHQISTLRDENLQDIPPHIKLETRKYAELSVMEIQKLIFRRD